MITIEMLMIITKHSHLPASSIVDEGMDRKPTLVPAWLDDDNHGDDDDDDHFYQNHGDYRDDDVDDD